MEVRGSLDIAGLERLSADPTSNNFTGRLYWNTTSEVLRLYANGIWNTVGSFGQASGTVKYELQIDGDLDLSGVTADVIKFGYLMYPTTTGNDVARTITTPAVASGELDQVALELSSYYFSTLTVQTPDGKLFRRQDGTTSATLTIRAQEHVHIFYDPDLGSGEWIVTETSEDDEAKINQVKRISANLDMTDFYLTNQKANSTSRFDIPISVVNESVANGTEITFFDGTTEDPFIENKRIWIHNPTDYTLDLKAFTAQTIRNDFDATTQATWTLSAGTYAVLIHDTDADQYVIVESNDPLISPAPYALDDLTDVNTPTPEDGQALVWDNSASEWVAGASGDASFKLQSISGQDLTIKSGSIILNDGRELRTSGGNDLTVDLSGYADDTYYFYIDLSLVPDEAVVSGRTLIDVEAGDIVALTDIPTEIDALRYIPLGGGTKATTWSNLFSTAFRRHDTGGSTSVNLFANGSFEKGLSSWTSTKPAQISLDGSTPLDGLKSLKITSDGAGQEVSTTLVTSSDAYKANQHGIRGVIDIPTTASTGDWVARFKRNGTTIANSEADLAPGRNRLQDLLAGFAPLLDTITFEIEDVSATASDVATCDIFVLTPQGQGSVTGVAGPWKSFTPVFENGPSFTVLAAHYRENGQNIDVKVAMTADANGAIATSLFMQLPNNLTIDSNVLSNSSNVNLIGNGTWVDISLTTPSRFKSFVPVATTAESQKIRFYRNDGAGNEAIIGTNIGTSDQFGFFASIPVVELRYNAIQLLDNNGLYQNAKGSFYDDSGQSIPNAAWTTVNFSKTTKDDSLGQWVTNRWTASRTGFLELSASVGINATIANQIYIRIYKNGSTIIRQRNPMGAGSGATGPTLDISCSDIYLVAGDYIEVQIYHSEGVSRNLRTDTYTTWIDLNWQPDSTGNQATGANTDEAVNENPQKLLPTIQSGSVTSTWSFNGGGTSTSVTVKWFRNSNKVTIQIPSFLLTSGTGSFFLDSGSGALPAEIRPSSNVEISSVSIKDTNVVQGIVGMVRILAGGTMQVHKRADGQTWTNSAANCGVSAICAVSYLID